jgi:hypothetical protein
MSASGGILYSCADNSTGYIPGRPITSVINRTSNVTRPTFHAQIGGSCYAHAAASAYINTCARIFGLNRRVPTYNEAVEVADYNHGYGGDVAESIRRLEEQFDCGVRCEKSYENPNISDVFRISVVVSFATSSRGWEMVAKGALLSRAPGEEDDDWHAVLEENFDLENDWGIGKNSWGHKNGTCERFKFRFEAFHDFEVVKVFFTLASITGKTNNTYRSQMERFKGVLDGKPIDCAYMDEVTAYYDSEFLCEECPSRSPPLNWIGYEMEQYIKIKLKRSD